MKEEIEPKATTRAAAYALWMKAPNPMVTFMILFVVGSALIAAIGPAKQIRNFSITETISEL
ncbi:MAG: hypothetical protein II969_05845 [Anaerolineaceae bacterium]|nr:hypothetical protein [Anaerolineaceae bacterium]